MELIWEGLRKAFQLMISFDPLVMEAAARTLFVSITAITIATVIGLPAGTALARVDFIGKGVLVLIFRASMAVPTDGLPPIFNSTKPRPFLPATHCKPSLSRC